MSSPATAAFETAFLRTVGAEGGYANNPADSGGETNWGITLRVARENGYQGAMADMTLGWAKEIYRAQYWHLLHLDDVALLSPDIAAELFDTAVNCGAAVAGTILQRWLNAFNRGGRDYPDIKVDGLIGPSTLHAFKSFLARRGPDGRVVLMRALNCSQGARYLDLAERREKDEAFIFGWILNRVSMEAEP